MYKQAIVVRALNPQTGDGDGAMMRHGSKVLSTSGRLLCGVLALWLGGCGANLMSYLEGHEKLGYKIDCEKRADKHIGDVNSGNYYLPEFHVDKWPGQGESKQKVGEAEFIDALMSGAARFALVTARGGLGKTRLAESIDAQVCATIPIVTVDLNKHVAAHLEGGGNPILKYLAKSMHLSADVEGLLEVTRLMHSNRWIMLADAIEEVELAKRSAILAALAEVRKTFKETVQVVVLARPAVLSTDYGIEGFDTKIRILPLATDRADRFIAKVNQSKAKQTAFRAFINNYGFAGKAAWGYQKLYPFMATYRDILVLRDLAVESGAGGLASYSAAHQHLVAKRLAKELKRMNWSDREVLDMVDRMVRVHREQEGASTPFFSVPACMQAMKPRYGWTAIDAGVAGTVSQRRRQVCEKALQSVIFEASTDVRGDKGVWHFTSASVAELFMARWVNGELARAPDRDCSKVTKNAQLFASGAIVRFLVGQPMVQRCFGHVMRVLCDAHGARRARHVEEVVQGLPYKKRRELVETSRAYENANGVNACVMTSIDLIMKTEGS